MAVKTVVAIDNFIQAIQTGSKAEIEDSLKYCRVQAKDFRLQALYRSSYKALLPIFNAKLLEFN